MEIQRILFSLPCIIYVVRELVNQGSVHFIKSSNGGGGSGKGNGGKREAMIAVNVLKGWMDEEEMRMQC